ncbi:DNA polymerase III subunit delta' [Vibrio sp. 10N.261.55.A7]|uniref:DNA polymerase III subunit delta' n=1 Tax=Vibrio sp. 10N.261.55.A7 TaxID=1880851 RepID=UPI000C816B0D|nr:DNA polymerase III subunit delta' [Vibrio sp. 10N.261.55.A7]PMJ90904.1 DNA polymerase III subunit delta' [Vibrio sp. 10N.261.55.A7]
MAELYPWLESTWRLWQRNLANDTFTNSTLLNTRDGLGTERLVQAFSKALMCSNDKSEACGFCHSCSLMQSSNHPDVHIISPEKQGKSISVEQIRQCNKLAQESSQLSGYRLFVIEPAEAMNESAANALLKTLESPAEQCVFLLVTQRRELLLPTIVSRCQQWEISAPSSVEASDWVSQRVNQPVSHYIAQLNDNAPLKLQAFIDEGKLSVYKQVEASMVSFVRGDENFIGLASTLSDNPDEKLQWLWFLLCGAQKAHFDITEDSISPATKQLVEHMSYDLLYKQSNKLTSLITQLRTFPGLNAELLISDWLIKFNEEICL